MELFQRVDGTIVVAFTHNPLDDDESDMLDRFATETNFEIGKRDRTCPMKGVQVFDVKGKLVEPEVWAKLLEKPRYVLLLNEPVGEKNPLDPFYMSIIREDTFLVFLPKQETDSKTAK